MAAFAYVASQVSSAITIRVNGVNTSYTHGTFPGAALGAVTSGIAIAAASLVVDSALSPKIRGVELRFRVVYIDGTTETQVVPTKDNHAGPLYAVIRLKATYDSAGVRTTTFRDAPNAATIALRNMFSQLEAASSSYQLQVAYAVQHHDGVQAIVSNDSYAVATFTTA